MRVRLHISKIASIFLIGAAIAEVNADTVAQTSSNAPAVKQIAPPALPEVKPPIAYFRELLAMPAIERERSIAGRSEQQKKVIRAKLKEYESMTAEDRELRLAVTELRWYLVPLMRTPPAERSDKLKNVPEEQRALVEDRLKRWDKLSSAEQKELLESEMTVNYFLRLQTSTPEQQTNLLQSVSEEFRRKLERELERWKSLPENDRDRMSARFQEFFELNPAEKEKTLSTLSEAERKQMERTLETFQNLSPEQRRQCIDSFRKLAGMSGRERLAFLQKAEAWEKMSPSDRKAWRDLVHRLPQMPPLPPGLKLGPPMPPSPMVATNTVR